MEDKTKKVLDAVAKQTPNESVTALDALQTLRFNAVRLVMENGSTNDKLEPFKLAGQIVRYTIGG